MVVVHSEMLKPSADFFSGTSAYSASTTLFSQHLVIGFLVYSVEAFNVCLTGFW